MEWEAGLEEKIYVRNLLMWAQRVQARTPGKCTDWHKRTIIESIITSHHNIKMFSPYQFQTSLYNVFVMVKHFGQHFLQFLIIKIEPIIQLVSELLLTIDLILA